MKFVKKPVTIEAFQFDGDFIDSNGNYYVPEWAARAHKQGILYFEGANLFVKTLEGIHAVSCSDYIIKGVTDELYPCKPDIFKMTYELASEAP